MRGGLRSYTLRWKGNALNRDGEVGALKDRATQAPGVIFLGGQIMTLPLAAKRARHRDRPSRLQKMRLGSTEILQAVAQGSNT